MAQIIARTAGAKAPAAAPVAKPIEVEFSVAQSPRDGNLYLYGTVDGKAWRIARLAADGQLHLRPRNSASGLDCDAAGYIKVAKD